MSIRKDSASYINRLDCRSATDLADNLVKKQLRNRFAGSTWSLVSGTIQRLSWHVEYFRLRNGTLGHVLGCQPIDKNPQLTVLLIIAIERRLQKLSSNFSLRSIDRSRGRLFVQLTEVSVQNCTCSCSTDILCLSQLQSSGLAHAWARYGVEVHSAHAQLNRFYLESTLCITCVTSRTRPSSCFLCVTLKAGREGLGTRLPQP